MKSLGPSPYDDEMILEELLKNKSIEDRRKLVLKKNAILSAYDLYCEKGGDPHEFNPIQLSEGLKEALRRYYETKPLGLEHIRAIRKSSPNICPMCGSAGSGTLDHVLPKKEYPEFAIFSWNLSPACLCNTLRSKVIRGADIGQRVLNPYFDDCMEQRLVRIKFDPPYEAPGLSIEVCCGAIQELAAVEFHVENVLLNTSLLDWADGQWGILSRRAADKLHALPTSLPVAEAQLDEALSRALVAFDNSFGTPNNWESMFIAGIIANKRLRDFLLHRINNPNMGRI